MVADVDERLAEVQVAGGEAAAVIDVHDVPAEEEVVDERDDAVVRRTDGRADGSAEVDAEMPAGHLTVEGAT